MLRTGKEIPRNMGSGGECAIGQSGPDATLVGVTDARRVPRVLELLRWAVSEVGRSASQAGAELYGCVCLRPRPGHRKAMIADCCLLDGGSRSDDREALSNSGGGVDGKACVQAEMKESRMAEGRLDGSNVLSQVRN